MKRASLWLVAAMGLAAACAHSGTESPGGAGAASGGDDNGGPVGSDGGGAGSGSGVVSTGATVAPLCTQPGTSVPTLRLLTRAEFDRTVNDIFPQLVGEWSDSLPADAITDQGFNNDKGAKVGAQLAGALLDTALSIATAATGTLLPTLLPCAATTADHECAETFLMQYGRRLFRRPLSTTEHDRYLAFFDASKAKADFKSALKWMTVGLIQSPNAVYRSEIGTNKSGTWTLSPYEVATELAYTYGGSTPSADLLAKADSGNLGDLVATAKSLLATDGGKEAMQHFFEGYLLYTRVTSMEKTNIPTFPAAGADMLLETRAFIDEVVLQKGGGLRELLTASTTNPSKNLAQYYGFPAPGTDYASITRPSGRGLGILAQGSFLATHANADASSPTQRGLFPYRQLLCFPRIDPPNTVPSPPAVQPGKETTRQRYEVQHATGDCAACHKRWDPIGFGFEHYDEGGRYRDTESGLTIDTSSDVPNRDYTPIFTFADQEGLVTGLAKLPIVYECFTSYLATYAFGTTESCLGTHEVAALQAGSAGIADTFASLVTEAHFTTRSSP